MKPRLRLPLWKFALLPAPVFGHGLLLIDQDAAANVWMASRWFSGGVASLNHRLMAGKPSASLCHQTPSLPEAEPPLPVHDGPGAEANSLQRKRHAFGLAGQPHQQRPSTQDIPGEHDEGGQ